MKRIGFIGVGVMGRHMAGNIRKRGYEVTIHDINMTVVEEMRKEGFAFADTPKALAAGSEMIITMLPSSPHVAAVALGENGIIEGIRPRCLYVDMSTIDPTTTIDVAAKMQAKEAFMLDSPVVKGVASAIDGTLTLYIGGEAEILEKARPVLECMGTTLLHMGKIGAGEVTKLVNNMCLAAIVGATSEMFVFGAKLGVDADKLFAALENGSAASRALGTHVKALGLKRKFDKLTFPAAFMMKDIDLGMKTAKDNNFPLFYPPLTYTLLSMLKAGGRGKANYSELIRVFEDYTGVTAECADKS
jgi:2-hydroxy-3-oxopropionate reductase